MKSNHIYMVKTFMSHVIATVICVDFDLFQINTAKNPRIRRVLAKTIDRRLRGSESIRYIPKHHAAHPQVIRNLVGSKLFLVFTDSYLKRVQVEPYTCKPYCNVSM